MIYTGVNHSVNRHQLMYKRKRHPRVEASQMPYSYQVAGPGIEPGTHDYETGLYRCLPISFRFTLLLKWLFFKGKYNISFSSVITLFLLFPGDLCNFRAKPRYLSFAS